MRYVHREKSILVDKNTNTKTRVSAKKTTERIIAQQWFGNLVTPVCWEVAWLNEGFATYFEYFVTATVTLLSNINSIKYFTISL